MDNIKVHVKRCVKRSIPFDELPPWAQHAIAGAQGGGHEVIQVELVLNSDDSGGGTLSCGRCHAGLIISNKGGNHFPCEGGK